MAFSLARRGMFENFGLSCVVSAGSFLFFSSLVKN
nr:MAG TPA: hypothetical protein [Caudoviricetes sp.]